MLTILEINHADPADAEDARALREARLEFMEARADLRYVAVQPDVGTWTEARGAVLVEHVHSLARRLFELVQLHRPSVILCGSPALPPMLLELAGARLSSRPALIGRWDRAVIREWIAGPLARLEPWMVAAGQRAVWWGIERSYAGFHALLVADLDEARRLVGRGLDRLYLTPMKIEESGRRFERELVCCAEILDYVRRGLPVPAGVHERLSPGKLAQAANQRS